MMMDRNSYIEFIEQQYFGNVVAAEIDRVLQCFTDDAHVTIRHGDLPERRFAMNPGSDEMDLRNFYEHLCANYDCWFGQYQHYIDVENAKAASRFSVRLTPKPGRLYAHEDPQELRNCNFFDFRAGRIEDMIIYYANPDEQLSDADTRKEKPTGYPRD